ncbi:MAG TPA: lysylphosphatidylglycerol synthase transmembrane domain-containing protein [Actinophytocola sp.]|uniref:lysylphosphatidylglycerol synthase transmembrane domain-containing protein n=1 Tax=Actinophytocola sp. TaxID=1872138 RepID=UPI002DDDB981|nr:lysylphosphatidylglycerol synthase transmembrane domain-containing protein [Actinophytocola sp.]HEV2781200.1 lysylphosphatidylglycerol synthase transmembrane domain-containing protein [Actinophytocola sp.]
MTAPRSRVVSLLWGYGTGKDSRQADRKRAMAWLKILVGLAILAALGTQLGSQTFVDGLRSIGAGELLAALAIGLVTTVLSAWRWCLVARRLGLPITLGTAVADYYRAVFLNSVLPAGVLGDVHRAVRHGREAGDVGRGVRAVVLERTAGQAVLIIVGAVALLAGPALAPVRGIVLTVLAVVAGLGLAVLAARRWARDGSVWRRTVDDIRDGLLARAAWPGVALLSAAALAGHVTLFVVAARAAGATAPVSELVPLVVLSLLAMGLPVNVGGWGPREGVAALVFGAAGLGAALGLTAAVVYGVLALVSCLPGAGVLVMRAGRREAMA